MKPRYVTTRKGVRIGYTYVPRPVYDQSSDMDRLQTALLHRRGSAWAGAKDLLAYAIGMAALLSLLWAKELYEWVGSLI